MVTVVGSQAMMFRSSAILLLMPSFMILSMESIPDLLDGAQEDSLQSVREGLARRLVMDEERGTRDPA